MDWDNSRMVETRIRRLEREIRSIEAYAYNEDETDRVLVAANLERRRDDVVRASVLSVHTAIEDLMGRWIERQILGASIEDVRRKRRTARGDGLVLLLEERGSLGFRQKINLALSLGLINRVVHERLDILNSLRNKCSHHWLLRKNIRRGRRPTQTKPPLLKYEGRDLHRAEVLKEFLGEFGPLYARLFVKYIS